METLDSLIAESIGKNEEFLILDLMSYEYRDEENASMYDINMLLDNYNLLCKTSNNKAYNKINALRMMNSYYKDIYEVY